MSRTASLASRAAALLLLCVAAAGCGGDTPGASGSTAFDDTGLTGVGCMQHQTKQPSAAYQPGPDLDSPRQIRMLRYYTANGNKDFCDSQPATATDRAWMHLYVEAGARADHVSRWLAGS